MTKTDSAFIAENTQINQDKRSITWPAADGSGALPALGYNAGDLFLGNYGPDLVYVSTDGTATLTFGATMGYSFVFSGTASDNTVTIPYSGPYLTIAPAAYDGTDEAFRDLIPLGQAGPFRDPHTKRIPITWFSGNSLVHGYHITPQAVNNTHLNMAHHARGHFAGGTLTLSAGPTVNIQSNRSTTPDTVFFVTDNGDGDGINAGRYMIFTPLTHGTSIQVISAHLTGNSASEFAVASPANYHLTFTTLFPPIATSATTTGTLTGGTTYNFRYCYTRTWNGVTIESALSPVLSLTGSTGYILTLGALPSGWTGYNLYQGTQVYASGASPITVSSPTGTATQAPSYGFFSWPPGTDLTVSGSEVIMKMGHLSGQPDVVSGAYNLHPFHPGMHEGTINHHAPQSITGGQNIGGMGQPDHISPQTVHRSHMQSYTTTTGTTPETAHKVAAADGAGAVVYEDVVPAAGSITLGMLAAGAVDGPSIANGSVTSAQLGFLANSVFSLDVTSGDTGGGSVNVSSWVSNTWYHFSVVHGSVAIKTFQQVLCAMTTDHTGESGYGDDGPVTWFRNSGGVYSDSTSHVPTGTGPQPILIASASDFGEVMLTSAWTDGTQLTVTGWGRVTASGSTKLTLRITLQGALQ